MEDVDEGFASNESNFSNPTKEDLLNDLKNLNGQKVIDGDRNRDKYINGKVCENGKKIIGKGQVTSYDKNGDENDFDLRNDLTTEEHSDSNMDVTTLSTDDKENLSSSSEDIHDEYIEEIDETETKSQDLLTENDLPNHKGDCKDKLETEFEAPTPDEQSNKTNHRSVNGLHTADIEEHTKDKNNLNTIQSNGTNSLNMTPVKQHTSSAEGERSPFLLDDKVRNSLKGLVAKVKSSELSREVSSPAGSNTSADSDGLAPLYKSQELSSPDSLPKEDSDKEKENNTNETDFDDTSTVDPYESILEDDEEGISMEIGSENEDELLELNSDEAPVKECNIKKTEMALPDEAGDKCANTKSNIELRLPEVEETNSSTPVEILSDNEDNSDNSSDQKVDEMSHDSVDKIQFEEDSNSNGSSGRINDIVDFLNHDLSATNSPLAASDSNKNEDCDPKIIDTLQMDTEDDGVIDENEITMEEDDKNEKIDDDTDDDVMLRKDDVIEDKITNDIRVKDKDISPVVKTNGPALETFDCLEKAVNIDDNDVEKVKCASDKENLKLNEYTQENSSGQTELVSESQVESDDEDDDVIFEGATMPAMRNEFQRRALSGSDTVKPDKGVVKLKSKSNNEYSAKVEDDDDVIFEKETKADTTEPKQNCDSVKTKVSAIEEKEITELSEASSLSKDRQNGVTEDDTSKSQDVKKTEKTLLRTSRNSSDRKRSAEDKEDNENESKRSKLDLTRLIGRLGSRVELPSIEVSDSEEEDEKPVATEDETSTVLPKDEKDEEDKKLITVTEKELDDLVREKVKLYLTSQRDTLVAKLSQKVKELQQNNDLWKRQVKDLQVKVNDVTVLQQKLEKRKAATAALRQITTRNVAVQVDEGRTMFAQGVLKQMLAAKMSKECASSSATDANIVLSSTASSKSAKVGSLPPRATAQVPFVSSPGGTGTIRLPIPQSSVTQALTTQLTQGSKVVTTTYQTPSVKSLLDTTRVQKTVGSVPSTVTTTIGTSVIGLLQYPTTYMAKPTTSQGFVQQAVTQVPTQVTTTGSKTVTLPSPNASKVIDLTDDDDSSKTRLVALQPGLNTVTNQGVRHVIAPAGTQFVRTGLPNQQTYQLVFTSPPSAIRPGMMMTMAPAVTTSTTILQTVPQSQTVVSTSPAVPPGTTLARAAVPATPTTPKASVSSHPAPFPALPQQLTAGFEGLPPKPSLKISRVSQGIVLSWNMSLNDKSAEISNYQLFAYQETSAQPAPTLWKKVGDVKALPLPMACTLTQFQVGNKYHFAVRAMDVHSRVGHFSDPGSIHLTPSTPTK